MNMQQGTWYKTEEERELDEYFLGCYAAAGIVSTVWNPQGNKAGARSALFLFPYIHFNTMWGNFLGFTSMPNREFRPPH